MENENKCFFSISLENGITITGENPAVVKEFLMDLYTAFNDCKIASNEEGYTNYAEKCDKHQKAALNAAHTIIQNYKRNNNLKHNQQ